MTPDCCASLRKGKTDESHTKDRTDINPYLTGQDSSDQSIVWQDSLEHIVIDAIIMKKTSRATGAQGGKRHGKNGRDLQIGEIFDDLLEDS